jgi:hypothetical protein
MLDGVARETLYARKVGDRAWLGMTATSEFGFDHWVAGEEWSEPLADYDVAEGRS